MISTNVGICAYVKEHCKYAEYYHCSAHALNLALVNAQVDKAMGQVSAKIEIWVYQVGRDF
jgi:hypothetical protein